LLSGASRARSVRQCLILARFHAAGCMVFIGFVSHSDCRSRRLLFSFASAQAAHLKGRSNSGTSAAALSLEALCRNRRISAAATASCSSI
jgi:hypothetical protein